jgi:hypothetical protein
MPFAYAIEDGVGVLFKDGEPAEVYSGTVGGKAYLVSKDGNQILEKVVRP